MRFFLVLFLVSVALTLGGVAMRNHKYPELKKGWDRSWEHRLALGAFVGMLANLAVVLYLWLKGVTF